MRLDGLESLLWLLAAWQSMRVARHLRGGVLSHQFWWIGAGFALAAAAKVSAELVSQLYGEAWSGHGLLEFSWSAIDCTAWMLVGIGAFRLRRAFESI